MSEPLRISDALVADVRALYDEVDATVAGHQPVCVNRGLCCRFGEYGHKLYVTDVELAYFLAEQGGAARPVSTPAVCPYQVDGKCTTRAERPLGCRIYFCDPNAQAWQGPVYERFLARLKEIGRKHGVAYQYREWLSALAEHAETGLIAEVRDSKTVDGIALPVIK